MAIVLSGWFFLNENSPPIPIDKPAEKTVKPSPEDFSLLLERMAAPPSLTPEEIEEEARIDEEQVAHAHEWLKSPDPRQRVAGAEQLSAYPTAQAKKLLVETLANDIDPEVRSTAARSLGFFKNPEAKTLDALLLVLESDNEEEVRLNVLNTLEAYVGREPYGSKRTRYILNKLKQIAESGQLQSDAQTVLQSFLADQAPVEQK